MVGGQIFGFESRLIKWFLRGPLADQLVTIRDVYIDLGNSIVHIMSGYIKFNNSCKTL